MGAEVKPIREYSVFNEILTYLREKDTESLAGNVKGFNRKQKKKSKYGLQSNTAINYLGDIKQFFRFYCKTEIEFLKRSICLLKGQMFWHLNTILHRRD